MTLEAALERVVREELDGALPMGSSSGQIAIEIAAAILADDGVRDALAEALGPVIERSLTWLSLWRFDKRDEDPWPALADAILGRKA